MPLDGAEAQNSKNDQIHLKERRFHLGKQEAHKEDKRESQRRGAKTLWLTY
jgi:hypothetical protein